MAEVARNGPADNVSGKQGQFRVGLSEGRDGRRVTYGHISFSFHRD